MTTSVVPTFCKNDIASPLLHFTLRDYYLLSIQNSLFYKKNKVILNISKILLITQFTMFL